MSIILDRIRENGFIHSLLDDASAEIESLEAEVDQLRAKVAEFESKCAVTLGVGDGSGQLFVHGDGDSIRACRDKLLRMEELSAKVADLEVMTLGRWVATDDVERLTKMIDVAWNGSGAAERPSLCDVAAQIANEAPVMRAKAAELERVANIDGKAFVLSKEVFEAMKAQDERQKARIAELERQAAIGRRAVKMLRELHWEDGNDVVEDFCIYCESPVTMGDRDDCTLAAILCDAEQAGIGVEL